MPWVFVLFISLASHSVKTDVTAQKAALRSFFESSNRNVPIEDCHEDFKSIGSAVKHFSVFNDKKLVVARKLIKKLSELPNDEMMASLSCLKRLYSRTHPSFVDFVLRGCLITKSIMKKYPGFQRLTLPPSYQTLPHFFFSEENMSQNESVAVATSTNDDPESPLAWWREDVGLGEHHCNWHFLNNFAYPEKHREGDLFAYMHLQMLARYDMERIALDLPRTRPFGPGYGWEKPLPIGYNPKLRGMSYRPQNMQIGPFTIFEGQSIETERLARNSYNLQNALARGFLELTNGSLVAITMNLLGNTVEANRGNVNRKLYGNLHNDGHNIIGSIPDPLVVYDAGVGVMTHAATAPRDPVFYEWHKYIDYYFFDTFRKSQEPYKADDLVIDGIEILSITTESYEVPESSDMINSLYTFMERGKYILYDMALSLEDAQKKPISIYKDQLNHLPYKIKVTAKNSSDKNKRLVFRVFLGLKTNKPLEEWRDMYIEMDKFVATVSPGVSNFTRRDNQSSVISPYIATVEDILNNKQGDSAPQKCGWPERLLLPRSNTRGMDFNLYVIATDWEEDRLAPDTVLKDGASYCGIGDEKFADSRPMGFPFDRKFEDSMKFNEFVDLLPNSMSSVVRIKFLEDLSR